ncbi:MAG: DUF3179 domain-containing protein [Acidobacteriota bacterium]
MPTLTRVNDIGITLGFFFTHYKVLFLGLSLAVPSGLIYTDWKATGRLRLRNVKLEVVTLVVVVGFTVLSFIVLSRVMPFRSLDNPTDTSADNTFIQDTDFVVGINFEGVTKAYPLTMMAWHHIVNDVLQGKPVALSYCPVCNTPIAFEAEVEGEVLQFDVATNYRANLVMVDRQTGSWWQQLTGRALQGELQGTALKTIPVHMMTWGAWKELHPDSLVLSRETGFDYDYDVLPSGGSYQEWKESNSVAHRLMQVTDTRYRARETILGVQVGEVFKAYPFSTLRDRAVINDEINGEPVVVLFEKTSQLASAFSRTLGDDTLILEDTTDEGTVMIRDRKTGSVWNLEGKAIGGELEGTDLKKLNYRNAFWFAWADFHPDTLLFPGD